MSHPEAGKDKEWLSLVVSYGPCWPLWAPGPLRVALMAKEGPHTPHPPPHRLSFIAELVLVKAPGVARFCFDRKYIKPRFTENTESSFATSLGPWLPAA